MEEVHSGNLKLCPYCAELIQGAAVVCQFCGRDIPKESTKENSASIAGEIGHVAGYLVARFGYAKILVVILLVVIVVCAVSNIKHGMHIATTNTVPAQAFNPVLTNSLPVSSPTSTVTNPAPVPVAYNAIAKYGQNKVDAANKVMNLVKQDCLVYVDGGLVVEMKMYIDDRNTLLSYVSSIADADAILTGTARSIFIYDPSNKLIASADSFRGIRLRD